MEIKIYNMNIDIQENVYTEGIFSGGGTRVKAIYNGNELDFELMFTEISKQMVVYKNSKEIAAIIHGTVCAIRLYGEKSILASSFCDSSDVFDMLVGEKLSFCKAWKLFYVKIPECFNNKISSIFKVVYAYILNRNSVYNMSKNCYVCE